MNDKRTKRPRLIPDAECVQSKCACMTTGCWDQCNLRRNPVFLAVPNHTSNAYSIIASPCQAGSISYDLQFAHLMGAYLDARLRKNGITDVSNEFEAICAYIDARERVAAAPTSTEVDSLKQQLAAAEKQAKEARHTADMYANAWQRELCAYDGKIFNKRHHIDTMVKTTKAFIDQWKTAEARVRQLEAAAPESAEPSAVRDVLSERQRQVSVKDWTPEHDDAHPNGEIAAFACVYAMPPAARDWLCVAHMGYGDTLGEALCPEDWEPKFGDRRRDLVKAGALILAEIERLDRATSSAAKGET